ncbi:MULTISPECIES: Yip1 family protein [unclassified Bacteroides]|uniref:Yip1 family protein n=1 Tax=unclassified Bacteroides TaxID=2646097 RepID=UPI00258B19B7|nr:MULTISPECIES: Yip1 family protein [unclassified Bacteroides]MDO3390113.1 Yip1 family protein [Bacteroides sp. ET489]
MNYKSLFHTALLLISSPARAWEEIRLEEDRRTVFTAFVYPMIGLCGLSVFIGSLLLKGWSGPESFQYAMTQCCAVAVSLFGGYFLAAYLINALRVRLFMQDDDINLTRQFAGYAMVVPFLLQIIIGVLPDFNIIAMLLQFYIVYVVWEGSRSLMEVEEKDRLRFTVISSILLIVCPAVIQLLFNKLTLLLN